MRASARRLTWESTTSCSSATIVRGTTSVRASPLVVPLFVGCLLTFSPARSLSAQTSAADDAVCLGFSFGPWAPPLDWHAAGHGEMPDSSSLQHAAPGRDWASAMSAGAGDPDSLLVLFPSWWPAGVAVDLPRRTPAPGDTVSGVARALVADGTRKSPASHIRAWRRPCAI
jgi:hypothetical protein